MLRRRSSVGQRGPGLAGTIARTAVIAGTASATSNAVNRRAQERHLGAQQEAERQQTVAQLQDQVADLQSQQVQSQVQAAGSSDTADMMAQLAQLAQMKQSGILSDAEFAAAKAKLLGM